MAKFEKVDPKQLPQLIILGVLSVGVFGYFGMQFLAPSKPPPKAAAEKAAAPAVEGSPQITAAAAGAGVYSGAYNPDPFRPVVRRRPRTQMEEMLRQAFSQPQEPARSRAEVSAIVRPRVLPSQQGFQMEPYAPAATGAPVLRPAAEKVAAAPTRPELMVTGIINPREGQGMALVTMGSEQRTLQVGDALPYNYRVRRVDMDGVLLTDGKDIFFVGLGARTPVGEAPAAASKPAERGGS